MARPGDITSKTASIRLPMHDYIKFLEEASSKKMSLSDFIASKLYMNKGEEALIEKLDVLENNEVRLLSEIEQFKGLISELYNATKTDITILGMKDIFRRKGYNK